MWHSLVWWGRYYTAAWRQGGTPSGSLAPESAQCAQVAIGNSDWTAPLGSLAAGGAVDVAVFTCSAGAELLVNGVSRGVVPTVGGGAAVFRAVPFAPGNLTAYAVDAAGKRRGSAAVLATSGPPARLSLYVETAGYLPGRNGSVIAADGADVALLAVEVLDASGVLVPSGYPALNVTFAVQQGSPAAVYGVANGDPADHSPVKGTPWRLTFHGRARLIVASTGTPGDIVVTASAEGVAPGVASLVAR
jgi:beta-galactosidase